ncbi:hypothetical protein PanWU01x14_099140 [Parasponia andersonii]|uniref:Uncharacterized protein n=1 Tax=Parasponia andersonii TaxID=3476 RepID=A0A2P5D3N7_PARAD|nr:hypothetical protein PanWU01x14_099140 [Parasponia andersonii]
MALDAIGRKHKVKRVSRYSKCFSKFQNKCNIINYIRERLTPGSVEYGLDSLDLLGGRNSHGIKVASLLAIVTVTEEEDQERVHMWDASLVPRTANNGAHNLAKWCSDYNVIDSINYPTSTTRELSTLAGKEQDWSREHVDLRCHEIPVYMNCDGPSIIGEISIEKQHLRSKNA